ncbi:Cytosolic Fe-S cluster assembly factor nubp1 [Dictyocoela muelleri]|nr:Cytosolic Fe-S cluster assembly factor nubp1 [Dictyocoela muelleri]
MLKLNPKTKILCVMSGKGGVGKSMIVTSLANYISLTHKTLILDLDITSPSVPKLTNTEGFVIYESEFIEPIFINKNLFAISSGYFELQIKDMKNINCEEFDIIVVDTPPGITDSHLDLAFYNASCILVSTPHSISISDVRRQYTFLKKANFSVLGIIENMKGIVCKCGHRNKIGDENVKKFCSEFNIPYLGNLDFDMNITIKCDKGDFIDNEILKEIAEKIIKSL